MEDTGHAGERQVRAARNESWFRSVNEKLEGLAKAFRFIAETPGVFTCECADASCIERIEMSTAEYEELRRHPNRFAVLRGHGDPDVEEVVADNDRYLTVAKIGDGAKAAADSDPRPDRSQ